MGFSRLLAHDFGDDTGQKKRKDVNDFTFETNGKCNEGKCKQTWCENYQQANLKLFTYHGHFLSQ